MERQDIERFVASLPESPGVYFFRDAAGEILYIGKAKSLRNRVRSYFGEHLPSNKIRRMVAQIADLEYRVVGTEEQALDLEANQIKTNQPKYNTLLKDGKSYPYIKISLAEEWPRIFITRQLEEDGARYFGPYTSFRDLRDLSALRWQHDSHRRDTHFSIRSWLDLLNWLFRFRRCESLAEKVTRRCHDDEINRCLGPCVGKVTPEEYRVAIEQATLFLDGRHEQIVERLKDEMDAFAAALDFERAADRRDRIRAIEQIFQQHPVIESAIWDGDAIGVAVENGEAWAAVARIRGHRLMSTDYFPVDNPTGETGGDLLSSFVARFYSISPNVPDRILVPEDLPDVSAVEGWLRMKAGREVRVEAPTDGRQRELVEMVQASALAALEQSRIKRLADREKNNSALAELARYLGLDTPPRRIECYDISNTQGTNSVGSMAVVEDGHLAKDSYRRFKIKTVEGANDFASLQEVLKRRFRRANGGDEGWEAPDLVIIDGGKGQLNAASEVFEELDVKGPFLCSLAKENEEIFVPYRAEPVMLPRKSESLFLVQRIRDEAHRFAVAYHTKLRSRRAFTSPLDDVKGIGPKRKAALIKRFGTIPDIRKATEGELLAVPGMDRRAVAALREQL